jgi:hypothetical protein
MQFCAGFQTSDISNNPGWHSAMKLIVWIMPTISEGDESALEVLE